METAQLVKWEYKIIKTSAKGMLGGKVDQGSLETNMNEMGREGWELVSAFDTSQELGKTRDVLLLFKRPLC